MDLGPHFRVPRHQNIRQWRKVRLMVDAGIRFFYGGCGCWSCGQYRNHFGNLADAKTRFGKRRSARKVYAR